MSRTSRERYAHLRQSFWRHPRVTSVSKAARWVYAAGLSYCADAESDGFITERAAVVMLAEGAKRDVQELVAAGLWTEAEGGYQVAGYLAHNKSKGEMQASREAMARGGRKGGGSNRAASATWSEQPTKQGTLQPTLQGSRKVVATEEERELTPLPPQGVDDDERQVATLAELVDRQLGLNATPGSAFQLLELLADLHSDADGRPYLQVGMCSQNDRKLLAGVIERAATIAEMHGITALEVIAGEWVALLSLAAAGETPARIGNVIAYFAKRFGEIQLARAESSVPEVPARQEAA